MSARCPDLRGQGAAGSSPRRPRRNDARRSGKVAPSSPPASSKLISGIRLRSKTQSDIALRQRRGDDAAVREPIRSDFPFCPAAASLASVLSLVPHSSTEGSSLIRRVTPRTSATARFA